jgi:hypothetical protein
MILNTTAPIEGRTLSSLEIITNAGYPVATTGSETFLVIRPIHEAGKAFWGEVIHLRHHPSRQLSIFADTHQEALEILAYEFHLWEVRESIRLAKRTASKTNHKYEGRAVF